LPPLRGFQARLTQIGNQFHCAASAAAMTESQKLRFPSL
jgi:hypothetical protein